MVEKCKRCDKGRIRKVINGKVRERPCPDCKGLGKIFKPEKKNGVHVTEWPEIVYGRDHTFENYRDDHLKASIRVKVKGAQQVLDKNRKILDRPDIEKLKRKVDRFNRWRSTPLIPRELEDYIIHDDYLVIAIVSMGVQHTKDHGKGYMYEAMQVMKKFMNHMVRYIYTNWDDSTKAGRAYLMRQGFKRDKTILIWENPAHATEHGFLQTPGSDTGNVSDAISKMAESSRSQGNNNDLDNNSGNAAANTVPNKKLNL